MDFLLKKSYNFDDLLTIMKILRSDEGCPWDREQNHESIKKNFIEETYEVVEAINKSDDALLCEELGDVLLQIVFHSQMSAERGSFDIEAVADGICRKLIERHPHVFSDTQVKDSGEVLRNWDRIKTESKHRDTVSDEMRAVPKELPALMRSEKLQRKAAKVGFDWKDVSGAMEKCREELSELQEAVKSQDKLNAEEELGDLLFSVVNVSRFLELDSEDALNKASQKFICRFERVERLAGEKGIDIKNSSLVELDKLWDEAKKLSR